LGVSFGGSGNYDQMERLMKAQVAKAARLGYRLAQVVGKSIAFMKTYNYINEH
jgi:hypothetical protein